MLICGLQSHILGCHTPCLISWLVVIYALIRLLHCFCPAAQPGQYPDAFVNEFKVFIAELRDFFNAAGLTSLLDEVKKSLGDENKQVRAEATCNQYSISNIACMRSKYTYVITRSGTCLFEV